MDVNHNEWDSVLELPPPAGAGREECEARRGGHASPETDQPSPGRLRRIDPSRFGGRGHSPPRPAPDRGAAPRAATRIVAARGDTPYASVEQVRARSGTNVAAVERLAEADAFRSLKLDPRGALWDARALKGAPDLPLFTAASARDEGGKPKSSDCPKCR